MRKSRGYSNNFFLVVISSMLCLCAAAQQSFRYKASLDSVAQNGFYTIHLSSIIVAESQPQFEDIRIKDNAGSDIPYIIKKQTTATTATNVDTFPLTQTNNPGKIVLQNSSGIGTKELVLFIKNTAAIRTVTLSGSDDAVHWFVIKENIVLAKDNDNDAGTSFVQTIHFPYCKYGYFQLSMQGKDALPLNIFKVGVYRTTSTPNRNFDVIPQPKIVQHDSSDKKSYIRLQFDNNYRIDQLQLSLSGAKFFNRAFTLYNGNTTHNAMLATGKATSGDSSLTLHLQVKANTLLLVINNLDNAPLTLSRATAFQLPVDLIAYLDAGKNYNLFFGNSTLQAPAYDLQYFSDSIQANVRPLAIKTVEKSAPPAQVQTSTHFSGWLLWSIIIAVLLLLIYFSYTLLKDINRKTTNTDAHL